MDGGLCGVWLLLAMHVGDQGDMDESKVLVSDTELELSHCFYEWRRFNVTDSTTQLNRGKKAFSLDLS